MTISSPLRTLLITVLVAAVAGGTGWAGYRWFRESLREPERDVPVTQVRRGDVVFTVNATGALQGGNSRMLVAPMTGSNQLTITDLRKPGELVAEGDVVAAFDTTEEAFKLREAEADLAEAEQQVLQARNESVAKAEELNYELIKARSDVRLAELECRRNELRSRIEAQQNDLTLADARERLARLERDFPARRAAAEAAINIQDAARQKAGMQAETARRNMEMMVLRAPAGGYVNVENNTNSNFFFPGMQFPLFQLGDQVRAGMAVAQIPDMSHWEASAAIAEQDRGHLAEGQPAAIIVIAMPAQPFEGRIVNLGGTTGPPWNRRFECRLALHAGESRLRPGMSVRIVITTETMRDVLWLPAQALQESDGRAYVYVRDGAGFVERDVKLVRRSESQVVIEGLDEHAQVALAVPGKETSAPGRNDGTAKVVAK
jgi:HlyD family secretion protein